MSHPFYLRLPYIAKLDNQIEPGQSLVVKGQATNETFVINLATSPSIEECKEVILHASFRVKEKVVVVNTLRDGTWGKEERHKLAIDKGAQFNIRIRSHQDKFEIFVNSKSIGSFEYRLPLAAVTHVQILGDLVLNAVGWEGNYYCVPYQMKIPNHFSRQSKLFLTLVPQDDERIDINFLVGDEDIAFHFNPRFNKGKTVLNSYFGGKWGTEVFVDKFPFVRKQVVDILFISENEQIAVYVDGNPYCTFAHRIDPSKIDGLRINGAMELQVVNFE